MPETILIVDDEADIREPLAKLLSDRYSVVLAADAEQALAAIQNHPPALALVDICMPGGDGISLCKKLRSTLETRNIPVIMMTGKDGLDTRIEAFDSGADDFLTKPFDIKELRSRIESKIRRSSERPTNGEGSQQVVFGDVKLFPYTLRAEIANQPIELGLIEFRILSSLMNRPQEIVRREELESITWGTDKPQSRALDTHITAIRKKLNGSQALLRTVYGVGYRLEKRS